MQTTLWKLMWLLLISFSIVFFSGALISVAFSQTRVPSSICLPISEKDRVLKTLETEYKEKRVVAGVSHKGLLINIYVNTDTGTWTILGFTPTNFLCILDTGLGVVITPENMVSGTKT